MRSHNAANAKHTSRRGLKPLARVSEAVRGIWHTYGTEPLPPGRDALKNPSAHHPPTFTAAVAIKDKKGRGYSGADSPRPSGSVILEAALAATAREWVNAQSC
jgi:hypothetical protein